MRDIRIDGSAAYIQLSKGYEAIIDIEDLPLVSKYVWTAHVRANTVYAKTTDRSGAKPRMIYLHRLILSPQPQEIVDHSDMNGLNNRRSNLRIATKSQNAANREAQSTSATGVKGVGFHKRAKKWTARVYKDGKAVNLGYFQTMEEAASAFSRASRVAHGIFARSSRLCEPG